MSPRVTYWTGTWDPAKEAISKEISSLRLGPRAHAPVISFSPGQTSQIDFVGRVLMLSAGAWPALRATAAVVERLGDVTHIFGGTFSWHLFRALGRRPIVLTAVKAIEPGTKPSRTDFARVVVETDEGVAEWTAAGIPRDRIDVIGPGIDLDYFTPLPAPVTALERFTLLFASTPADPAEFDARGLPLLVELARLRPDVDILLPWRQWGDQPATRAAIDALGAPANFRVMPGDVDDMRSLYAAADATVSPFARGAGKACPNFVLEGLACGRPCLTTTESSMADRLVGAGAGIATNRDARSLAAGVDALRADATGFAASARTLAESDFDLHRFRARYDAIYRDVATAS